MKRNPQASVPAVSTAVFVVTLFAVLAASAFLLSACRSVGGRFAVDTTDSVEAISRGLLGAQESIVIRFKRPIDKPEAVTAAVRIAGGARGAWRLLDDRTLEFAPEAVYPADGALTVSVDTGRLAGEAAEQAGFTARFAVRPNALTFMADGLSLEADAAASYVFRGSVAADLPFSAKTAAKTVSAVLVDGGNKRSLAIEWLIGDGAAERHAFVIRGIERGSTARTLTVSWNGAPAAARTSGSRDWLVPAAGDFRVLEIAAIGGTPNGAAAEKHPASGGSSAKAVQVRFSEALDESQDLRGFIDIGTAADLRYEIDSNLLKLYGLDGGGDIAILAGIQTVAGDALDESTSASIDDPWEIPEVRFADPGVILPPTAGVIVPIETRNLRGAIVEAYRIHADTILQFLQVNELDESYELARVGDPVWTSNIDFDWDDGMKNRYVARGLDLSELTRKYPGGMFQLRVTFRARHVEYQCTVDHEDFSRLPMPSDEIKFDKRLPDNSNWNFYDGLDWETRSTYWAYGNDPCHPAFYIDDYHALTARKNVLVSDLAIMAKLDGDGAYHITVASIGGAAPVDSAAVALYSYTRQLLAAGTTGSDGQIILKPSTEAYFIAASASGQTSYLRIDAGASLSVSHFAVDGETPRQGLKGFIYGERGVWRPGDDLRLTFILQDLANKLPDDFPITFELEDPRGRVNKRAVFADSVDGFYRIDTSTGADDPTGAWTARVTAGGQTWTKPLRVEAVIPNRLAIKLETAKPYLVAANNAFTLSGAWLHGAKAPGLKADVQAVFYPGDTVFAGYGAYSFTNPGRAVRSEQTKIWDGKLGADSAARFKVNLNAGDELPGMLNAQLTTRIFEPSGLFSIEQAVYKYSPYERYIGVKLPEGDAARGMLLTDVKHRLDIVALDAEGKPAKGRVTLDVAVYKLEWRWWWEKDALTDAAYVDDQYANQVASGQVTVKDGAAAWEFEVKYPQWGRYMVMATDRSGGHSAADIVYIDWPGWAGRGQEAGTGSAAMLSLAPDRDSYRSGETARVSFASGSGGRALATVEKDGRVLAQDWLETEAGTTVYEVALDPSMAPNVYVHITLLQKHLQTANDLPVRLYGVVPLMVEDPATRLSPVLETPAGYTPGQQASFVVSEKNGRPMTYTVAVVDEGLLGLTRFAAADPWDQFYKKEASRLLSWDIYRYVMSAYGGKLETLLSIGGSENLLNGSTKKAERFKSVVLYFGPYRLAAGERSEIGFIMPAYVGAVRVMAVAGRDGAYGRAEATVPVKAALMAIDTLPRTLGAGESVDIPITVFNGGETARRVSCELTAVGAATAKIVKELSVASLSDATVVFRVDAKAAGKAVIKTIVTSLDGDGATATTSSEIDVLSRGSRTASAFGFTVEAGATWKEALNSPGESGTRGLTLELSTMPVIDFATRSKYLISYPHGCLEQITSGGFAQLYLPDLVDLDAASIAKVKTHIESVIERYGSHLLASGGFAYWAGGTEANEWGTSYAGHFLLEARRRGYAVPNTLLDAWAVYQKKAVQAWSPDSVAAAEIQAYRLYTLALAGRPEIGGMNRLLSWMTEDIGAACWLLVASYDLTGHHDSATDLARVLVTEYIYDRETGGDWGSPTRDAAIALHVLDLIGDENRATETALRVAEAFGGGLWYSTQETAWMLLALTPRYRKAEAESTTFTVVANGETRDGAIKRNSVILELPAADADKQNLEVMNSGARTLYAKATTRGVLPAGQERAANRGLTLEAVYVDSSGATANPERLALGASFTINIAITNRTKVKLENIVLTLPVPTAWEFANERVGFDGSAAANYDYRDVKDTSIDTFLTLNPGESRRYAFQATVAYGGTYYLPAIRAEAMYEAEYQATLPGRFINRER